jgi:anti-anti-sigma factor
MVELAVGWDLEVERGPDWLFVKIDRAKQCHETPQLAEKVWELMQQQFRSRVVLEMDGLPTISSYVIGQLVLLHKRVTTQGGLIRLCGLSQGAYEVLEIAQLADRFPRYRDRTEAIRGHRPLQPR